MALSHIRTRASAANTPTRDGPVEQRPVAVPEAVDRDAVFAVHAHTQDRDRKPEGHRDDAFDGAGGAPASRDEVHPGRDREDDGDVAGGLHGPRKASRPRRPGPRPAPAWSPSPSCSARPRRR